MDNNYKVNINLNNLRTEVSKREDRKNKTFDKLVEMCYSKIINTNKTSNEYSCIFEVPNLVFGLPLYNINDAIKYIMIKLIDKGFEVHLAIPNKIFISWKPESEKLSSYCRDLYQLDNPNKLSLEYYPITNNPNLQYNPSIQINHLHTNPTILKAKITIQNPIIIKNKKYIDQLKIIKILQHHQHHYIKMMMILIYFVVK